MTDLINHEAERAVVGAVLSHPDTIAALAELPLADAFYDRRMQAVYRAMLRLWERKEPATVVTVPRELMAMGGKSLEEAEGYVHCLLFEADPVKTMYATYHAGIVLDLAARREAVEVANGIVRNAYGMQPIDVDETAAELRRRMEAFTPVSGEPLSFADQAAAVREEAESRWRGDLIETVVPTGIKELDKMLNGGIRLQEFMVLAGRPGMGKSSVALDIAKRCRALYVSLEMPWKMLHYRLISAVAGVPYHVGITKVGDVRDRDRWLSASEKVEAMPLTITDTIRTTDAIEREALRIGADVVFVDHLGRLGDTFKANVSTYDRMSALSWRFREMTLRNPFSVVGLSQLNREVENRKGCLPFLSDLRDSGKLEEDANHILLLYNRAYYVKKGMGGLESKPEIDYIAGTNWERILLNVAKNRNGIEGSVEMGWHGESMSLHDPEERWNREAA